MLIDLHIHSNFSSDGEKTPSELLIDVKNHFISIFSITDHNTIAGCKHLLQNNKLDSIEFITGVEFSCSYDGNEIHLLSYNFDINDERYPFLEKKFKKIKEEQAIKRCEKLKSLGFYLNTDEVLREAGEKAASGVTFLNVLKKDKRNREKLYDYLYGEKSNSPYTNFYFDFFRKGWYAYVEIPLLDYYDTINLLKDTFLVIAHPGLYKKDVIPNLIVEGIRGIEAYSSYHNDSAIKEFCEIARDNDLIVTCGSDYHGKNIKPDVHFVNYQLPSKYQKQLLDVLKINC